MTGEMAVIHPSIGTSVPERTPLLLQLILQDIQEVLPLQFQVQVVRYQVVIVISKPSQLI